MIRRCLETAFKELGVTLKVVKSDGEFENADVKSFDIIVLDPWTWAAKGNTYTVQYNLYFANNSFSPSHPIYK